VCSYRIGVIGAGYVGLTTAACFARLGHRVVCTDIDESKVNALRRGTVSAREPGLSELVVEGLRAGRLTFVAENPPALTGSDMVFLCLPTPSGDDGAADLRAVHSVVHEARDLLAPECVVVIKSTVPAGTTDLVQESLARPDVAVVNNPEFLREGHAVEDFLRPQRVVVGSHSEQPARRVVELYADSGAPAVLMTPRSAELVKYASNCFLAMKLSYVNTLAELCERIGADIDDVTEGMRYDDRIGSAFLAPGPGWGGSCLPKDTRALLSTAHSADVDFPLLSATIGTNSHQQDRIARRVRELTTGSPRGSLAGVRIGMLGLTFKAGTDDLRDSPALAVARLLAADGAELTGYDPCVPRSSRFTGPVEVVDSPHHAAEGASALVVLTEWPEFSELDWPRLAREVRNPVVLDTRNVLAPKVLREAGFQLHGLGRPAAAH
jgi:UDPglucose 6-dehydrogenase